jgi:hypothetical protein
MPKNLILAASLPASPERLFDMYLDPMEHAAFTGAPVTIGAHPGAEFRVFDGQISGAILLAGIPDARISGDGVETGERK